jgi:hypothetical protein
VTVVTVRHPAALRFVPDRARAERIAFCAMATPVTLREIRPGEMEPVSWERGAPGAVAFRHEGKLWSPLRGPGPAAGPVDAAAFRAFLEGDAGTSDAPFAAAFRGTPLMAWGKPGNAARLVERSPATRGEDVDLRRAQSVALDGRTAAADAVRRHLDAEVRIRGDRVYLRSRPLAYALLGRTVSVKTFGLSSLPRLMDTFDLAASPATYGILLGHIGWDASMGEAHGADAWLAAGIGDELRGEEHRAAANSYPGHVRRAIDVILGGPTPGADPAALLGARDAMLALEIEGATGICGEDDPGVPLRAVSAAIDVLETYSRSWSSMYGHLGLRRAIHGFLLPTLPSQAIPPQDAMALSGLSSHS